MVLHPPVELAGIIGNWLFPLTMFRERDFIRTLPESAMKWSPPLQKSAYRLRSLGVAPRHAATV